MKNLLANRKYRGTCCLNCEHPLDRSDNYCPNCGQINSTKKPSFDDFFNEFFAGIFAYDSRVTRTLKALLFHPGKITREYIKGKRIRYANPFRFYLSASIIFFILWSFTNDFESLNSIQENNRQELDQLSDEEIAKLRNDLKRVPGIQNTPVNLDSILAQNIEVTEDSYREHLISENELDTMSYWNSLAAQVKLYNSFYRNTEIKLADRAMDSLNHNHSTYNRWLYKKVTHFNALEEDPGIFFRYFINKLPFIIFFYLPILALFIWLLYARRPFNYMEHLIFTFHVQTTFFVLIGIAIILDIIFNTEMISILSTILFLFYLFKAMRRFYGQGRFKTIVKFILLNGIFLTLAVISAIVSLLASFAIF